MSLALATALVIGVGIILLATKKKRAPLPPGPQRLPLVGNISGFPPPGVPAWKHWLKHKDLYGPISCVTSWGTTLVILNSQELAFELFEKRSKIYSSRTRCVFGGEMVGWENNVSVIPYNAEHRASRKRIHITIGTEKASLSYLPLQAIEAHRFLFRVLQEPEEFLEHIKSESGSMFLRILYGYTIESRGPDPLVRLVTEAVEQFSDALAPGAWFVDVIPALRYIPEWMPGAGFKRTAKAWRACLMETVERPFRFTREQMAKGVNKKSYVADFGSNLSPKDDEIVKWTALTLYAAGMDTVASVITSFFLAMARNPEVQYKAREEIDRIIGTGRLPEFSDRDRLPYVTAVTKEAFRWQPLLRIGFPRATSSDDVVNGYYIPKGSIVLSNVWWFTHDPDTYPNPLKFDPSRFLGANPCLDPRTLVFGYGRRICPGRYFAYTFVWLTIAQSLAVFDISKPMVENAVGMGELKNDDEALVHDSGGLVTHVAPFKAVIKPRSSQHEALIRQVETLYPREKSNADDLENIVI